MKTNRKITHLGKGFTEKKSTYNEVVRLWKDRISNILPSNDKFKEWIDKTDGTGKNLMDGNPIYSLMSSNQDKAIRIMQIEPRAENPYMSAWREKTEWNNKIVHVLSIGLELSTKTLMESLSLIELWFKEDTTPTSAKINFLINRINKEYEQNYVKSEEELEYEFYSEVDKIKDIKKINIKTDKSGAISEDTVNFLRQIIVVRNEIAHNNQLFMFLKSNPIYYNIYMQLYYLASIVSLDGEYKLQKGFLKERYRYNYLIEIKKRYSKVSNFKNELIKISDQIEDAKEHLETV
jgi:hypothetical protein